MADLTMGHDIIYGCSSKAARTVLVIKETRGEYYGGRTVDDDEIKTLHVHFKHYHIWKPIGGQKISPNVLTKS